MNINEDDKHLNLLATFHFILGGVMVLFACVPLIHMTLGIAMASGALSADSGPAPPEWFGMIFAVMGGLFFLFGQAIAWLTIYSGFQLKKRTKYMFSFVVACIMCVFMPIGTLLGIFTIIVLTRSSVKKIYGQGT